MKLSLFRVKDRIPPALISSVIYLYSCGQCTSSNAGQTSKQLLPVTVSQHKGVSFKTNNPLTNPEKSIYYGSYPQCKSSNYPREFRNNFSFM